MRVVYKNTGLKQPHELLWERIEKKLIDKVASKKNTNETKVATLRSSKITPIKQIKKTS